MKDSRRVCCNIRVVTQRKFETSRILGLLNCNRFCWHLQTGVLQLLLDLKKMQHIYIYIYIFYTQYKKNNNNKILKK